MEDRSTRLIYKQKTQGTLPHLNGIVYIQYKRGGLLFCFCSIMFRHEVFAHNKGKGEKWMDMKTSTLRTWTSLFFYTPEVLCRITITDLSVQKCRRAKTKKKHNATEVSNFINTEAFILSKILAIIVEKDRPLNLFDQDRDTPTKGLLRYCFKHNSW